ncbi:MAG: hypothetical protein P4L83_14100 [Nevskia sp.]|nr:hypothetical protein [Nevskia sp.]
MKRTSLHPVYKALTLAALVAIGGAGGKSWGRGDAVNQLRLVGIVSLGDMAKSADCSTVGRAMSAITQPAATGVAAV